MGGIYERQQGGGGTAGKRRGLLLDFENIIIFCSSLMTLTETKIVKLIFSR